MQTQHDKNIRIRRWVAGVSAFIWAALIFVLSAIPGDSYPGHPGFLNYVAHFGEYAFFAALLVMALANGKLKSWHVVLIAITIASAYGALDEFHQLFVPLRFSDPMDWLTDTCGASIGAALCYLAIKRVYRQ